MRTSTHPLLAAVLMAVLPACPAVAQQPVTWGASVRPRFESRTVSGGSSTAFTGMQTRLSLSRELSDGARLFVQLQDVRLWGSETGTGDGSADFLDLHQGYFELGGSSGLVWARIGRQEMQFAEGRLVGTPPWSNVGQSFDGVRAAWRPAASTRVDAFGMQIREADAVPEAPESTFLGLWSDTRVGEDGSVQLFALHDRVRAPERTARTTVGTYAEGSTGAFRYRVEGALQRGRAKGLDVRAHMVAVRVGWVVDDGRGSATLWYDRYSGDANPAPGETRAFSDLYGSNHSFFGYADLLKHIPEDTGGRGVQDLALKLGYAVRPGTKLGADLHRFLVTDASGLEDGLLANEADLYMRGPVMEGVDFLTGLTRVDLGTAGLAVGLAEGNVTLAYLQLRAAF